VQETHLAKISVNFTGCIIGQQKEKSTKQNKNNKQKTQSSNTSSKCLMHKPVNIDKSRNKQKNQTDLKQE